MEKELENIMIERAHLVFCERVRKRGLDLL
jgi:hypothetical protein